ncbi:unnamed protein product [Effrenium voratum]|nr:unnamed protein product [Effrenium voratum]
MAVSGYADLEATLWFEHLCCGLLSPQAERDFTQLNPFLSADAAAGKTFCGGKRIPMPRRFYGQTVLCMCRFAEPLDPDDKKRRNDAWWPHQHEDLADLLANPEAAGSSLALAAGLGEKASANVLCGLLASKRTYVQKAASADGGFKGIFDPHYLVFEFVTGFLLRPRQVEMVNEFSDALRSGKSSVKQMIMGAGKTSVVSPLLALMHANGSRIVCLVVPPALISLSRSVLQNCFSTVVQKRVSTFKCDRSLDLEVALSERLGRIVSHGDILLTTPGDVKSLELRFLEQLDLANDRQARRNTTQMRRECVQMGRALQLMKEGVCMIDEVDLVLHPLRSELNFPIGPKNLIEHAPERWRAVLHLLDGFFSVEKGRVPPHLKDSLRAKEILQTLGEIIRSGCERRYLQCNPHLILLSEEFYHKEVGRAFEQPSGDREDRGLSEDEVRAYLLHRVTPQRLELEASLEAGAEIDRVAGLPGACRRRQHHGADFLRMDLGRAQRQRPQALSARKLAPDVWSCRARKREEALAGGFEPVARSSYLATRLEPLEKGNVRLVLEETQAGADVRGQRVERLPAKDAKSMNLSWDWLQVFLPFSLQKIDRVTFGIMSSEQVSAALAEQPLMPLTRAKLAIPFVGKDVPSQSSEFAHPDVVIGLTILAYRYEGLRREDFDEVLGMLCDRLESEAGAVLERPTSLLWRTWVEESGADFCVKQAELDEQTSSQVLGLEEGGALQKPDRMLPLHLLERRNEANMAQLFELVRKLPSAVHFYLEQSVFPQFMRFQDEKLSASGQDLGGSILFGQRIGFSGTPSDLMPRELGQCDYEPGSEGEMVSTMTDTQVVTFEAVQPGWNVELLLDSIIEAAHQNRCNALIDTGALITGLTNQEVAEYLLGFGRARAEAADSPSARSAPTLPDFMDGVVFLDDDGGKKILLRQTREITKLADSGVPAQKRFAFYDQVHTTGMDIQHKLDAVAALTLGKDMCWRDYVQGAYRMRGIGRGQRICLYVIPEVVELISRDLILAGIEQKLQGPAGAKWTACEKGRLLAVAAWLLVNSIRTERIQFAMLQLQNLANVWRRNAFKTVMTDFEVVTSEGLKEAVQIFKEANCFHIAKRSAQASWSA